MMPYLDAALAFALTMLAVATLSTQIVRVFRNTTKVRREGLKEMLEKYFNSEFVPVIQRELKRLKKNLGDQVVKDLEIKLNEYDANKKMEVINNMLVEISPIDISTEELIERLKRSNFGQNLLENLSDKAQKIFDELGKRYEVIGNKSTESFRKKSRIWSAVVALVLAFVINIDSIYIINMYVQNESMRHAVIAQKDAFVEDYNALSKTLEEEKGKDSFTKAELEEAFKDSRKQLNVVTSVGFPIGWSYFPHSYFQVESTTSKGFQNRNNFWGWSTWLLGILITGALAGLGGPFWYDVIAGISRVVQRTRAAAKKPEQP